MWSRIWLAVIVMIGFSVPHAAEADEPSVEPFNAACVAEAHRASYDMWVCVGDSLTYRTNEIVDGRPEAVWRTRKLEVGSEQFLNGASASKRVTLLATTAEPSNYDTYCENVAKCTGYASQYVSWTKVNAAYGYDGKPATGTFDAVLRTRLNGRQPQYITKWYHDSGPALSFNNVFVECRENNDNFPDESCGQWGADNGDGNFYVGTGSFSSPVIYGNRLNDSNDYFSTVDGYFTPNGHPQFAMDAFRSATFNCFNNDNCYFPGA